MSLEKILLDAKNAGIKLSISGGKLTAKGEKGKLSESLRAQIKANKQKLIEFLEDNVDYIETEVDMATESTKYVPWLSYAQQRIWFLDQLGGGSVQYNIPGRFQINESINVCAFEKALKSLIDRHEVLRTHFSEHNGEPSQIIVKEYKLPFEYHDLSNLSDEAKSKEVNRLIELEATTLFNLSKDLMLRVRLIKLATEHFIVLYTQHHIASDGWSMRILKNELSALYRAFRDERSNPLTPLKIQYADYALWQKKWLDGKLLKKQLAYWHKQLSGLPNIHKIPLDKPRPLQQRYEASRYSQGLEMELSNRVIKFCQNQDITLYIFLQSIFAIVMSRFSNEKDLVIGTPISGRTHNDVEELIGFFVNSLVLRSRLDGNPTFMSFLKYNKETILDAFTNQHIPFEMLVENIRPERDLSYNPIFQVLFVVQNNEKGNWQENNELSVEKSSQRKNSISGNHFAKTRFDFELHVNETDGGIFLRWVYNTSLFNEQSIKNLSNSFYALVENVLKESTKEATKQLGVHELSILSKSKELESLYLWNDTDEKFENDLCLHQLFEYQANVSPDTVAIIDDNVEISYLELNEKANRLANFLSNNQVHVGSVVGVCFERSIDMVVTVLAILKTGAAYLPIDPGTPESRVNYIIKDSTCKIIVGYKNTLELFSGLNVKCFALNDASIKANILSMSDEFNSDAMASSELLAYIIYTSGSTGTPKGVMINHRNVVNYVKHGKSYLKPNTKGAVVSTALVFDATVCSLFIPLCFGRYIELVKDGSSSLDSLSDFIVDDSDNLLFKLTPSHLKAVLSNELLEANKNSEHTFVIGGEQLSADITKQWLEKFPKSQFINEYGPTETTVGCSVYTAIKSNVKEKCNIPEMGVTPIGKPVSNSQLYVLNEYLKPQPDGVIGELYIAGEGVSNGYINQAGLTAEKFIPNPFSKKLGCRLYRTGDLAKRLHNGELEFIKRADEQVKIRGYRIELGDIETAISEHEYISNNAVVASLDIDSNPQLVSYICPSKDYLEKISEESINESLNQWTEVFNDTYNQTEITTVETNYSGWDSSYTMQPIENEQMDEWLDSTISVIKNLEPKRLLEIGCGTGLLLFRYANFCETICAIDISQEALANVASGINSRGWQHIELIKGDALSISQSLSEQRFDSIVINSVAQYFPNRLYFEKVLDNALSVLTEGGKLLLGDIRNLDLFEAHVCAVEQSRLTKSTKKSVFSNRVQRRIQQEQELLVSPSYFIGLKETMPEIASVDILVKRGIGDNEMNRYRYEVVITKESHTTEALSNNQINWHSFTSQLEFEKTISQLNHDCIGFSGVPNPRIAEDSDLYYGLKNWPDAQLIHPQAVPGKLGEVSLEEIKWLENQLRLVEERGFEVAITWSQSNPQALDIIFSRIGLPEIKSRTGYKEKHLLNYPRLDKVGSKLSKMIQQHLVNYLPQYMIPSLHVVLERLPLTTNGKIDKGALPLPKEADLQKEKYVSPSSMVQQKLCDIWQDILNVSKVGVHDNFFSLGGHSLLATRLISAIRREFAVEIQIRMLFESPTIVSLSQTIESARNEFVLPNIRKLTSDDSLTLSFAQQRLWFVDQLGRGSTEYNMRGKFTIESDFNQQAFIDALDYLIKRHQILRTNYLEVKGKPVQKIQETFKLPYSYIDVSEFDDKVITQKLRQISSQEAKQPFDLGGDLMIRVTVVKQEKRRYSIFYTIHHIAGDAWSIEIFKKELKALYSAYCDGKVSPLNDNRYQYADYASWQKEWLSGKVLETQLNYWKKQLNDLPAVHSLPLDKVRPSVQSNSGRGYTQRISNQLSQDLKDICKKLGVSPFMFLQTAFSVLIFRYSNHHDVVMGTPVSGRVHQDVEDLIGFFVNTLVLRSDLSGNPNFDELLLRNKKMILDAQAHQHVPFDMLVDEVLIERNITYNPIFQILFDVQTSSNSSMGNSIDEDKIESKSIKEISEIGVRFDLALHVKDNSENLAIRWSYRDTLFDDETILRMVNNYECLLRKLVYSLTSGETLQGIGEIEFVSEQERALQLNEWNNNIEPYNLDLCIHQLIEEQVNKYKNEIAVVCDGSELTYGEFNRRANQLANLLIDSGIESNPKVILFIDRSIEAMVALLGILKSGAAYIPIDSNYPPARINYMIEDSGATFIITKRKLYQDDFERYKTIFIDDPDTLKRLSECGSSNIPLEKVALNSHKTAYIIYTSGSTGKPKGVVVNHRSVCNFLNAIKIPFRIEELAGSIVSSPLAFDATVQSLFLPLCAGKYVEVIPEDEHLIENLADYLVDDEERLLFKITPSHLKAVADLGFVSATSSAKHVVVVAGEMLTVDTILPWKDEILPNSLFINEYGPTEATVGSCIYQLPENSAVLSNSYSVPIGSPLNNVDFYVLDQNLNVQPIGAAGELYIGGEGLASCYLNKPGLTADKFIDNPFKLSKSSRMYKTGDLVRWNNSGELEFLSRIDEQVKLRGYRIELGEIETLLNGLSLIKQTVVVLRETKQKQQTLVAYLVLNDKEKTERGSDQKSSITSDIKSYLSTQLPDFMLPSSYVIVNDFKLTPSGKVDKSALPEPGRDSVEKDNYKAPQNTTEKKLCRLWESLLEIDIVGINDNFFALGGHSLLATRLISLIREEFQSEIQLRDLFESPTISDLSEKLNKNNETAILTSICRVNREERIPLSYAQQRLWFIDQLSGSVQYNMPGRYVFDGDFDLNVLENTLIKIINRHEVLRTKIKQENGEAFQSISEDFELPLNYVDCSLIESSSLESKVKFLIKDEANTPFDLANDIMFRVKVLKLASNKHLILYTLHHIVSDGWSLDILRREMNHIYTSLAAGQDERLPELKIQYADYAVWQQEWFSGELQRQQLKYWRNQLTDIPKNHSIPLDYERPEEQSSSGFRFVTRLDSNLASGIKCFCDKNSITLFIFLQSIFSILLSKYSNSSTIVMGVPVAGRLHKDLEGLIGFFVNSLVLKSRVPEQQTFLQFLEANKSMILDAYSNQHTPFEMLVEELMPDRSLSHNPLFQIMFSVQNNKESELNIDGEELIIDPISTESDLSKITNFIKCTTRFDLELRARESAGEIILNWSFNSSIFNKASMERISSYFENILTQLVEQTSTSKGFGELLISDLLLSTSNEVSDEITNVIKEQSSSPVDIFTGFNRISETDSDAIFYSEKGQYYTVKHVNLMAKNIRDQVSDLNLNQDSIIAIYCDCPVNTSASVLALSALNTKYILLDSKAPYLRTVALIEKSGCKLIINDSPILDKTNNAKVRQCLSIFIKGNELTEKGANQINSWTKAPRRENNELSVIISAHATNGKLIFVEASHDYILKAVNSNKGIGGLPISLVFTQVSLEHNALVLESLCAGQWKQNVKSKGKIGSSTLQARSTYINNDGFAAVVNGLQKKQAVGAVGQLLIQDELLHSAIIENDIQLDGQLGLKNGRSTGSYLTHYLARYRDASHIEILALIKQESTEKTINESDHIIHEKLDSIDLTDNVAIKLIASEQYQASICYYDQSLFQSEPISNELKQSKLLSIFRNIQPCVRIPIKMHLVDKIPFTDDGMVAFDLLPSSEDIIGYTKRLPAVTYQQIKLCKLWQDLLNIEQIGINENFFKIGGHSLLATRLTSQIRDEFNVEIQIKTLFENPTVEQLSQIIAQSEQKAVLPDIKIASREDRLPLSYAQQRLWFIDQLGEGSSQYNIRGRFTLKGEFNLDAFQSAFNSIIQRHEVLRTTFEECETELVAIIHEDYQLPLAYHDLVNLDESHKKTQLQQHLMQEEITPFNLRQDTMIRGRVIQLEDNEVVIMYTMHHIASDGWSKKLFQNELYANYQAFVQGKPTPLAPLPIQYTDYAVWQREWLKDNVLNQQLDYWKEKLKDIPSEQCLPLDFERPKQQTFAGEQVYHTLDKVIVSKIENICSDNNVTLFVFLETVFSYFLNRYTRSNDIVIGVPIAGRNHNKLEDLIGLFVNTLMIRTKYSSEETFKELLERNKNSIFEAFENQSIPFEMLVDALQPKRSLALTPLTQIFFSLQNVELGKIDSTIQKQKKFQGSAPRYVGSTNIRFDLELTATPNGGALSVSWAFNKSLFKRTSVLKMAERFSYLIAEIISDYDDNKWRYLSSYYAFIPEGEKQEISARYDKYNAQKAPAATITESVSKVAKSNSGHIAIIGIEEKITYQQLELRATSLALKLQNLGVTLDSRVGINVRAIEDFIVSVLAILKCGACIVPINASYPELKKTFFVEKGNLNLLIVDSEITQKEKCWSSLNIERYILGEEREAICNENCENLSKNHNSNASAIVEFSNIKDGSNYGYIYSYQALNKAVEKLILESGNENVERRELGFGNSKEHSIVYLLYLLLSNITISEGTVATGNASTKGSYKNIDSVTDKEIELKDDRKVISDFGLFPLNSVNSLLEATDALSSLSSDATEKVYFTSDSCCILDARGELLPDGMFGDFYLLQAEGMHGYLGARGKTAEHFVPCPIKGLVGVSMLSTSLLARRISHNIVEIKLGRIKQSTNSTEVEQLRQAIHSAKIVQYGELIRNSSSNYFSKYDCYFTQSEELSKQAFQEESAIGEILEKVRKSSVLLPLPNNVTKINSMPMTEDGDYDVSALKELVLTLKHNKNKRAGNEVEYQLVEIWSHVLNIKVIGVDENFFEIGGNSLLATKLINKLRAEFEIEFPLKMLFEAPTIEQISKLIFLERSSSQIKKNIEALNKSSIDVEEGTL